MPRVACHDMQCMPARARRYKPVDPRNDLAGSLGPCRQFTPDSGCLGVDREDAIAKLGFEPDEPRCKRSLFPARNEQSDALGDLADGQHAKVEVTVGKLRHRSFDTRMPVGLAQFGQDAGIEESPQRSTSRLGLGSRARSSPSKDSPLHR